MKQLLLIDAHSLIHRAYHAIPRSFTSPKGEPVNALFGLSRIMLKIAREKRPDYAAACFDRPEPTFRKKEYDEYKAQRPETPNDLVSQLVGAHELFDAFGVPVFEAAGFEADDIIATLVDIFQKEESIQIVILTGDRDTLQLVQGEKIVVRAPKKGISETILYDEKKVTDQYGLAPYQLIDYKALVGDVSDNIKGVPGIGPKTAMQFLSAYGTLDALYKASQRDPMIARKLEGTELRAHAARRLVELRKDVPLYVEKLEALSWRENRDELISYFKTMGFASLVKELSVGKKEKGAPRRQEERRVYGVRQGSML